MEECINFEISFAGKVCNFISLHRSPSQSHDIFETFVDNPELNLDTIANKNPYFIVVLGQFNVKSSNWYKHDKTTYEGSKIEAITSPFGLKQLTQEPTHILSNPSSCINLVFTSQPNLVMESGLHSLLHENCHHQLVYAKFNLKVWYPPPYGREIMALSTCKILIKSKEQLNSFLGKNHLVIFALMKWSIYSTILSKIFSQITFPMKQLLVMIETHLGLTKRLSN